MLSKLFRILFLLAFLSIKVFSIEVVNFNFEAKGFTAMEQNMNKTAILGINKSLNGLYNEGCVFILENEKIQKLPTSIKYGTQESYLLINQNSRINIDSTKDYWITGLSLYQYSNSESKWIEHYIDDSNRVYRNFQQICVDKFNNVWVTTSIVNTLKKYYCSELYKFENNKFNLILKFEQNELSFRVRSQGNIIAALPNGKITLYRTISIYDSDTLNGRDYRDLYFINQDGSYLRKKVKSASNTDLLEVDKAISNIYVKNENHLLISSDKREYKISEQPEVWASCCSGIVELIDEDWYIYNDKNGLAIDNSGLLESIFGILEYKTNQYMLIGNKKLYHLKSDKMMYPILWEDIFDKSEFLICNSEIEKFVQYFLDQYMASKNDLKQGYIAEIRKDLNGNILILLDKGIIRIKPELITSIDDELKNNTLIISEDQIILNTDEKCSNFEIYDLLGNLIKTQNYLDKQINIANLSNGIYLLRLHSFDGKTKLQFFNKID